MKNGSHSRHSYPFDKMVPKTITNNKGKLRISPNTVIKKLHNKKQRQHNQKLCKV